ncbi:Sphingomyelin phosphodiesterase [Halocaridina rubra]|uniref:Sphingomyelin phosphodiesterase n=1 Tax=Halocaridina rubra TaxID=373956 RepID=A0AAN8WF06_HALRR
MKDLDRPFSIAILLLACTSQALLPAASPSGDFIEGNVFNFRFHHPAMGPEDLPLPKNKEEANIACLGCQLAVAVLQEEIDLGASYDALVAEGILVCLAVTNYTDTYCEGYVPLIAPIVYHILTTNNIDPQDFCGMIMSGYGCNTTNPARDWTIEIQGEKPPIASIILPDPGEPTLKVLHLADTHFDPLYLPGSNADCGNELCCREESGVPETPEAEAWFWGDYRKCGSPRWMLEDMLTNIVSEHPLLYWVTIPPHFGHQMELRALEISVIATAHFSVIVS